MNKSHPLLDAHEIAPKLWQGSLPPRGNVVRLAGFKVLVLCARELIQRQQPESFPGVRVIQAPNDDSIQYPLTRDKLRLALQTATEVVRELKEGNQVLVTCAAGLNRSGLVSALALHKLYGWAGEDCVRRVRERRTRSKVHPGKALSNPEFVAVLKRLRAPGSKDSKPLDPGWGWSEGGIVIPL